MDVTGQLAQYYLSADDVDDVTVENGVPHFPRRKQRKPVKSTRRILIYIEFPSVASLLKRVSGS